MNFIKGVIVGTAISAGAWMIYSENTKGGRNTLMRQGKRIMKKMGMM